MNKFFKYPPQNPIVKGRQKLDWSQYQKDIFQNIATESGHLIVEAYAGSAKTSSIIESLHYIPKGKKTILLAFNKKIQEELKDRAPSYINDILTFHALGFRAIKQRFGNVELDDNKVNSLIRDLLGRRSDPDLVCNLNDTVAFCKYGLLDLPKQIDSLIDEFGIDTCNVERDEFIRYVIKILAEDKNQTSKIDFNDMCWFPYIYNLFMGLYDMVFVDEAFDLNKSQLIMAKKICKPNGRLIVVGDELQQIYRWRLADTTVIKEIKNDSKTKILPLPISYRCPKKVIELAKEWAPDITCPDSAIDGDVQIIHMNELYAKASSGCFILSRTNAPLIKICMNFIRNGQKANIRGRDVGKQLSFLIRKSKKKDIKSFIKWLENWKDNEVEKLINKNINPEHILDRYECLVNLCDECTTLEEVVQKVTELFNDTDENNIIILSTVHRAKGAERDDVFLLRWTFRVWLDTAHLAEKPNEEYNIAYVACTRAKKKLYLVRK